MIKNIQIKETFIQAIRFTGSNDKEIADFVGNQGYDPQSKIPSWIIKTPHGEVEVLAGDWIIRGINNAIWSMREENFKNTYIV